MIAAAVKDWFEGFYGMAEFFNFNVTLFAKKGDSHD
jgi:hypothetical protein